MIFLDGQFLDDEEGKVSIFDRSFCYGDGLFETLRIWRGSLFRWPAHWERFERGAQFLRISVPSSENELRAQATELIRRNNRPMGMLRIQLSRGIGRRGYSPQGADRPLVTMTVHPVPECTRSPAQWSLTTSPLRIPTGSGLTVLKTCNKLLQIVARTEAEARGMDDALLLNTNGDIAEATSGNVFWIEDRTVYTPGPDSGALPGVTRAIVLELCRTLGLAVREEPCLPDRLNSADGVFLTQTGLGIIEAISIDGRCLARSPRTSQLQVAYEELLSRECASAESQADRAI